MSDAFSFAELQGQWQANWLEEDFSWEGLARVDQLGKPVHPWLGWRVNEAGECIEASRAHKTDRLANLQDYWRDEATRLIDEPGTKRKWTRMHCPMIWKNGGPSPKASWSDDEWESIAAPLSNKLHSAKPTSFDRNDYITGTDFRAQFSGIVARRLPVLEHVNHIIARHAYIIDGVDFTKVCFGPGAQFNKSCFKRVFIRYCEFQGFLSFDDAVCNGGINLWESRVDGRFRCSGAVASGLDCEKSRIENGISATDMNIEDAIKIKEADITGDVYLSNSSSKSISMNFSKVHGDISIRNANVGGINLAVMRVDGGVIVEDSKVNGIDVAFSIVSRHLQLSRVSTVRGVLAKKCSAGDYFSISGDIGDGIDLSGAKVGQDLYIENLSIGGKLDLSGIDVVNEVYGDNLSVTGMIDASNAKFGGGVTFSNLRMKMGALFYRVRFGGVVSFHGASFHQNVSFDGAEFSVPESYIGIAQGIFYAIFSIIILSIIGSVVFTDFTRIMIYCVMALSISLILWWSVMAGRLLCNDLNLEKCVRSFQSLSKLLDGINNGVDAARFRRLEFIARRLRYGRPGVFGVFRNVLERGLSCAYDSVSRYGNSLARPVVSLLITIFIFSFVYNFLDYSRGGRENAFSLEAFGESTSISLQRVFPFGVWSAGSDADGCSVRTRLLTVPPHSKEGGAKACLGGKRSLTEGASFEIVTGLITTAESIIAGTLVLLFGLAVRKRFQAG